MNMYLLVPCEMYNFHISLFCMVRMIKGRDVCGIFGPSLWLLASCIPIFRLDGRHANMIRHGLVSCEQASNMHRLWRKVQSTPRHLKSHRKIHPKPSTSLWTAPLHVSINWYEKQLSSVVSWGWHLDRVAVLFCQHIYKNCPVISLPPMEITKC